MIFSAFQVSKVQRAINTHGKSFDFERDGVNDFGEPNGTTEIIQIKGIYHEAFSYITKAIAENATTEGKYQPMILTLWEDAKKLNTKDRLTFNGANYTIGNIKDITESKLIAAISLERVV